MISVEAADGISVKAANCRRVQVQGALGLLGGSFQKRIDQRAEVRAKVLENHDAVGNVASQQGSTMTATRSATGEEGAGDPFLCQTRDLKQVRRHGIVSR